LSYTPRFQLTPSFLNLITQATELRAWIARSVIDVVWLPRLQRETASRLAHSSTSIEGNPLTLPEVEALARGETTGPVTPAVREVLNCLAAMRWIWNQKPRAALTEDTLLQIHRLLTKDLLPALSVGHYKTRPNRIVDSQGRTVHTPPPPEQARSLTQELIAWISSPEAAELHAAIVSAVAHHRLVSIHPFSDGNGRVARALGVWVLYTRGFDTHHLFALDEQFEADRARYYLKIQQARDLDDDLTYWLDYVGDALVATLRQTRNRIQSLAVSVRAPRILLTRRQEDVLRLLRDKGRLKSPDIERAFRVSRARVGQIVTPLITAGLVLREGQTRATTYSLADGPARSKARSRDDQ
jgi:Fic family protein